MEKQIYDITPVHIDLGRKKRVAAYARVSCDKDTMLHSLAAQIDYYRKYIIRNPEWEFVGVYADEAKTGTTEDREQFQKLLSDCRSGLIDIVITKSISRFARNTVTLLGSVRELKGLGMPEPDEVSAYSQFIVALCAMSKSQKRVNAVEKEVENEKYAFRCLLLRLGFIGDLYRKERKILLRNLSGSSAFKNSDGKPHKKAEINTIPGGNDNE